MSYMANKYCIIVLYCIVVTEIIENTTVTIIFWNEATWTCLEDIVPQRTQVKSSFKDQTRLIWHQENSIRALEWGSLNIVASLDGIKEVRWNQKRETWLTMKKINNDCMYKHFQMSGQKYPGMPWFCFTSFWFVKITRAAILTNQVQN